MCFLESPGASLCTSGHPRTPPVTLCLPQSPLHALPQVEQCLLPRPDLWLEGVCVTASHKITLLCHTLQLKDAVASTTASEREGRGLGGIKLQNPLFCV